MAKTALFKMLKSIINEIKLEKKHSPISFDQSRRKLLANTLMLSGLAGAAPLLTSCSKLSTKNERVKRGFRDEKEVLIVGAGAAGLAAAYQLKKAQIPYILLEGSKRVGGRIFTKENFNQDSQFIEVGAELVDTNHTTLISLATELGLQIENFITFDQNVEAEIFYYKNKVYKREALVAALRKLIERTTKLAEQVEESNKLMLKFDRMSLKEYLEKEKKYTDLWALKMVEVAYVGELGLDAEFISSYSFISMFAQDIEADFSMFGESDESKRVVGGNSKLIEALYHEVDIEGRVRVDHQLIGIKEKSDSLVLSFKTPAGTIDLESPRCIITIPLTTLRNIDGIFNLDLTLEKKQFIRELNYGTNSKFMLGFDSRFWRKDQAHTPANTGAVFGDFKAQSFWETSRLQKGSSAILTNFSGGIRGKEVRNDDLNLTLQDLMAIYPMAKNHFTGESFLMNWSRYQWNYGSYACVGPGQYTSFWGTGKEIELKGKLQLAGEHTSEEFQGFMNGAYESGIRSANNIIKELMLKTKSA